MKTILIIVSFIFSVSAIADELIELRKEYANHFIKPEVHLRLAKLLTVRGDHLTAYLVSEAARRVYFDDQLFDRAFHVVFRNDGFDNSAETEQQLLRDVAEMPKDAKKRARLADVYISREDYKNAEVEMRAAIMLEPNSVEYVSVLSKILSLTNRRSEAKSVMDEWFKQHPHSVHSVQARITALAKNNLLDAISTADAALREHPENAYLHFQRAMLFARNNDPQNAKLEYIRATELDKDSAEIQGWTARFLLMTADDPANALKYYLNAYFIDPHFYDTEYAESRIRSIAYPLTGGQYSQARESGASIVKLLKDPNPYLVGFALEEVDEAWRSEFIQAVIGVLSSDDPNNRYRAADILGHRLPADDERVDQLLQAPDLRVRGAAAYIAGTLRGEKVVPLMESWLSHPAELIRYDAISVLATTGGPSGYECLMKVRESGTLVEPRFRKILDSIAREHDRKKNEIQAP